MSAADAVNGPAVARFILVDEAPGETSVLLVEDGAPAVLWLDTLSDAGQRPRVGEIWGGRTGPAAPGGQGLFVDLGPGGEALLPLRRGVKTAPEGERARFCIVSEGHAGKGPVLARLNLAPPDGTGLLLPAPAPTEAILAAFPDARLVTTLAGDDARAWVDRAWAEIASPVWPLPDGGTISLESTRALWAVDVDSGAGRGEQGMLAANRRAGGAVARAIRLKEAAGLIVIDPAGRERAGVVALMAAVMAGFRAGPDPPSDIRSAPYGLVVLTRRRTRRSLAGRLAIPGHRSLMALRALDSAMRAEPGRRFLLHLSRDLAMERSGHLRGLWQMGEHFLITHYGVRYRIAGPERMSGSDPQTREVPVLAPGKDFDIERE